MNKNETVYPSLIRPISKLLVLKTKSQFRLVDDPNSDDWNVHIINKEKLECTMLKYFLETLVYFLP